MLEKRNHKLDVVALVLLAVGLFLLVSLITYHPADLAESAQHFTAFMQPVATPVKVLNACGRSGAYAAEGLFRLLGWGAYYLVVTLVALDVWLLARRPVSDPALRAIGWVMSLLGITTVLALVGPAVSPGPIIGPGGYMGAAGRAILEINFASAGAYILTFSILFGGLILCSDYLLVRLSAVLLRLPLRFVGLAASQMLGGTVQFVRHGQASLVGSSASSSSDIEPAIRFRGKRIDQEDAAVAPDPKPAVAVQATAKAAAASEDDEEEEDESDEHDSAAENATAKRGLGARLASALRIRNNGRPDEREEMMHELEAASHRADEVIPYEFPSLDLLLPSETVHLEEHEKEVRLKAKMLEKTFANFGFNVKVVEIETGPVIAQYEVELEAGLRLSKITSLADDLAIALRVPSVRIVAPIPGKNTVGIEVPNNDRQLVRMREVIEETNGRIKKMRIPLYLGKDVAGNPMVVDLASLPHLLIAGRTGTGKSVCLNSIITSIVMTRSPNDVRMLMIDPKMVELSPYKQLPHLMHPVVTDMRKAEAILAWAVEKMEERYALLARAGTRHISLYNQLDEEELMRRLNPETEEERAEIPRHLPYIVIVADEMADLMMVAAKEVEQHIIRLAQKSRAVGIHLVLATQKPTVDVITGLIKSNLPARICFQVASRTDSRVVLDEMGADKLLGNGDMLFLMPATSTLLRGQGTYLSDDEINGVLNFVATTEPQFVTELVQLKPTVSGEGGESGALKNRDELYEQAVDVVVREGRGSVSLLQRALGIGYGRAARLVDFMAEDGIVGEYNGSQAREVLITLEQWATMCGESDRTAAPKAAAPTSAGGKTALSAAESPKVRRNRIVPAEDPEDDLDAEDESEAGDEAPWVEGEVDEESDDSDDADSDDHSANDEHDSADDDESDPPRFRAESA